MEKEVRKVAEETMVKVKVVKRYVDRFTKKICKVEAVLEYGPKRAEELVKNGYVEKVEEKKG